MSNSLWPHGLQLARSSGTCSNSCMLSWWCHPTIPLSVTLFSSCLQSFPASGSFLMSQLFASGGQSIGTSDSALVLLMNIQDWFPLGWTGRISLQFKGLSSVFSSTTIQKQKHISSVQSLSWVWLFATPWIAACQASLSITISRSSLRLTSIESVMPSKHLILCHPLLLLPSIIPSIRVFSNESLLDIRWPKYWSFSFSIVLPMNIQDGFPLGWTGWISLQSKGLSRVFFNTTVEKHQFFGAELSL